MAVLVLSLLIVVVIAALLMMMKHSERFSPLLTPTFMAAYNPVVHGVSFANNNEVFKKSAVAAGMFDENQLQKLMPPVTTEGESGYEANKQVVQDSLELYPTQEFSRLQLSAALANYIPEEGINNLGLFMQRNYLQNLQQPGLSAQVEDWAARGMI
jgi:hypothetical protein